MARAAEATATTAAATNKQTRNGPFAGLVAFHGADITVIAEPDTAPTMPNFVSTAAVFVVVDGGVTDECRCSPQLLGWNGLRVGRTHVVSKAFVNMNHSLLSLAECLLHWPERFKLGQNCPCNCGQGCALCSVTI